MCSSHGPASYPCQSSASLSGGMRRVPQRNTPSTWWGGKKKEGGGGGRWKGKEVAEERKNCTDNKDADGDGEDQKEEKDPLKEATLQTRIKE